MINILIYYGGLYMKKIFKYGIGLCFTSVLLASCSNGGSDSKESNSSEIKMGEILKNDNEHISYILNEDNPIEKESEIDYYILTKDGKAQVFDGTSDTTLGDVSKMKDDEIKKLMEKEDKKYFNEDKNDVIKSLEEGDKVVQEVMEGKKEINVSEDEDALKYTKKYIDENGNVPKKSLDKIKDIDYSKPKPFKIDLAVNTDGSGNETDDEVFKFKAHGFSESTKEASDDTSSDEYYYTNSAVTRTAKFMKDMKLVKGSDDTVAVTDIYDKKYAGLSYLDDDDESVNYLITEVGDKAKEVELDTPDDKYVDLVDGEKK